MTTGEKISESRKKLGLTQQQFADELGVTRQAVSRWESDLAFPETDTLLKMSGLFGCSVDYLLKYNAENAESKADSDDVARQKVGCSCGFNIFSWSYEYKSKRQVLGMPLVHINIGLGKRAHGFFSVGLISSGIFSLGMLSAGVFSFGCLSAGLITLGALAFGGLALGALALGLLAFGGVAIGLIAFGGLALGLFSCGGCSVGLFAVGGYADGYFVAVGDVAHGRLAFGETTANGSALSVTKETFGEMKEEAWRFMDGLPQIWQGFVNWCKHFAERFMA